MADQRRLEHAVAGVHDERLALVLVDHLHPPAHAVDHLEADPVEVHVVGDRSAVGDADVRRDEPSTLATRVEVAVLHPRAPDVPLVVVGRAGDDQRGHECGDDERRVGVDDLDESSRSVR